MCLSLNAPFDGNKVLVCQVGDLKAGDRYRTPEGETLMVLDIPPGLRHSEGETSAVNEYGAVRTVSNSVKLGRDRMGRLYASRYLNNPRPDATADANPAGIVPPMAQPDILG